MPLQRNNNEPNQTNPQPSPHNQPPQYNTPSPNFGPPSQAHLDPRNNHNSSNTPFTSPPPAGYTSPTPLPNTYHPNAPQTPQYYNNVPPTPQPQMYYGPPQPQASQPQLVFLGMLSNDAWGRTSKPMYGPPGSTFDSNGNVYFPFARGHYHEYLGPYRMLNGKIGKTPEERREDDCCWTIFGDDKYYWQDK